jgi:hypothetical protein
MGSVLVSIFAINQQFPLPLVGQLQQETVSVFVGAGFGNQSSVSTENLLTKPAPTVDI